MFPRIISEKKHFREVLNSRPEGRKKGGPLSATRLRYVELKEKRGLDSVYERSGVKLRIWTRPQRSPGLIPYTSTNLYFIVLIIPILYVRPPQIPASSSRVYISYKQIKQFTSLLI